MTTSHVDSSIQTRVATAADREQVAALVSRYHDESGRDRTPPAQETLPPVGDGPLSIILAELDGQPIGMVAAHRCYAFAGYEPYLLLSDIFVVPEHRRRKVASALMAAVKVLGQQLGISAMRLFVQDVNEGGLITAARSGFTLSRELLLAYRDGEPTDQEP